MKHWMMTAYRAIARWIWPQETAAVVDAVQQDEGWKFDAADIEQSGHFYFRRDILEHLGKYFIALRRMRKMDRESYDLYRRVGANVLPGRALAPREAPPTWRAGNIPAFGAICLVNDERDRDAIQPTFMYFTKMRRLVPHVQAAPTEIIRFTAFYDDIHDVKIPWGWPITFHCYLDGDGQFKLLRELEIDRGHIPSKRWDLPRSFMWVMSDPRNKDKDPHQTAHYLMCIAANFYETSSASTRVSVNKGDLTAVFGVDIKRTPYFFKDRDMVTTASGARKRIFHVVRPHMRSNGKAVKMHFRGSRDFVWNDYRVLISVPGLHHINLTDDGPASTYADRSPDMIDSGEVGKMLQSHIRGRAA